MRWFESMFEGKDKPQRPKSIPQDARLLFDGPMRDLSEDAQEGISRLMNYALNCRTPRPFAEAGQQVVFQLNDVTLGVVEDPSKEISAGDFEIIVRRVR